MKVKPIMITTCTVIENPVPAQPALERLIPAKSFIPIEAEDEEATVTE